MAIGRRTAFHGLSSTAADPGQTLTEKERLRREELSGGLSPSHEEEVAAREEPARLRVDGATLGTGFRHVTPPHLEGVAEADNRRIPFVDDARGIKLADEPGRPKNADLLVATYDVEAALLCIEPELARHHHVADDGIVFRMPRNHDRPRSRRRSQLLTPRILFDLRTRTALEAVRRRLGRNGLDRRAQDRLCAHSDADRLRSSVLTVSEANRNERGNCSDDHAEHQPPPPIHQHVQRVCPRNQVRSVCDPPAAHPQILRSLHSQRSPFS